MRHQFHENVCFCPKCGVRSLLRDFDNQGHNRPNEKQINGGTEWWCTTCGFGFRITKSKKWTTSDELHRLERKVRLGNASDNTNPATRDAFIKFLEKG